MKIVQLNCWGGKLSAKITRLIEQEKPDIVCLQEATDLTERPGSVIDPFSKFLPEKEYPHVLFAPGFSYRYMHEMAGLGNAIVSKTPFDSTHVEFVAGAFVEDIETVTEPFNNRNFAHVSVAWQATKKLHIITHHGHHNPDGKDGSSENTNQIQRIATYIEGLDGPVILTGDFNLHPNSTSLEPLHKTMRNLCVEYGIESTRTELAKRQEVIDYFLLEI